MNALATAIQSSGARSPQAMNALTVADPMAAMQMGQRQPPDREALGGLVRGVLAVPEEQRPQAYAIAVRQAQAMGAQVPPELAEYPGDQGLQILASSLQADPAELTQFQREMAAAGISGEEAAQAYRVRFGLQPDADTALRVGASQTRQPTYRSATPDEAARYGAQAGQIDDATGRFYPINPPSGMSIESDGAGGIRVAQGPGVQQRPFTEGQSKDNVYLTRATGALADLEAANPDLLASFGDRAMDMDFTGAVRGNFQNPDYQVAKTAFDEFLQAILRKDTGAAITSDEQLLYGKTYGPEPGDQPPVLAQKKRARERAVAAMAAGMSAIQMVTVERALARGEITEEQANEALSAGAPQERQTPPPNGIAPDDWEFMTPEERALFE